MRTALAAPPGGTESLDAAFEAAFRRHYGRIQGIAHRLAASDAEAEELTQEAFLRLCGSPVLQKPEAEIGAWLVRVVTNLGLNTARGRAREQARLVRVGNLEVADAAVRSSGADPASIVVREEERRLVREALAELPPRARACLGLRHSGLSYAEVARALEVAPGSVGTLLARAERLFVAAWKRRNDGM
ncbi:MAG: sigma-70 family RNA polymerase sigma factor [Chloroflexi bacterium]|nr:sigma-70 family RNA polymerase sigma factor [Chloroflexota bacterium]